MSDFGNYIRALRESQSLTLREVERQTEVSNAYLSQLESGKIKQPSPTTLYKLSELYQVKYEALMEKAGYPAPKPVTGLNSKNTGLSDFVGDITADEELELIGYLKFIRNRKR